jgi:hypothetical protein
MKREIGAIFGMAVLAGCGSDPAGQESAQANMSWEKAPPAVITPVDPAEGLSDEATPTPSRTEATQIPAAFRGKWDRTIDDCGAEASETRLAIEADRILFYESAGTVIAVTGRAPQIAVRASYTGEGETWESSRSFRLSPDGQTLRAEGMVRVRCP